jgi:curved DNA-binding protein CbpA
VKSLSGLNYYEVLEIPVNASFIEIKRYSMFSNDERDTILKKIEKAFLTLIDENKRAAYDKMLVDSGHVERSNVRTDKKIPTHLFHTNTSSAEDNLTERVSQRSKRSIEENQLENLPADIYLKNFLKSYAEILQIDSQRIVDGYLKNISLIQKMDH